MSNIQIESDLKEILNKFDQKYEAIARSVKKHLEPEEKKLDRV